MKGDSIIIISIFCLATLIGKGNFTKTVTSSFTHYCELIANNHDVTMAEPKNGDVVAAEAENKAASADAPDLAVDPSQQVFKNLAILPPLQQKAVANRKDAVPLPPIRAEEPVSSIRAALSEIKGYAHLTNYRFVLENDDSNNVPSKDTATTKQTLSTASPYTGLGAVIATKQVVESFLDEAALTNGTTQDQMEANLVLDEFGDLMGLLGDLKDGSCFRVVLERYDIALIRDHIARLRTLLDGNAPTSVSLDEGGGDAIEPQPSEKDTANESNGKEEPPKEKDPKKPQKDMPVFDPETSLSPDINDLKKFFYHACGEDPSLYLGNKRESVSKSAKKKGKKKKAPENGEEEQESKQQLLKRIIPQLNEIEEQTRVSCDIRFSGFHPPPQHRQFMGDLAYLEVTLPDGDLVSISATPIGFYVNRSSLKRGDLKFDPSPAETPCFSHELLDCLMLYSKSFSEAWNDALVAAKTRADLMLKINEDGPFQSFFRVAIRGDFPGYKNPSVASASEGIDALVQIPSWLVPVPKVELEASNSWNRNCEHTYSSSRTEGDLSNSFGVDIRNGSLRDWNEELQVAREMPMGNLLERIERARYVKILDHCHLYNSSFSVFD